MCYWFCITILKSFHSMAIEYALKSAHRHSIQLLFKHNSYFVHDLCRSWNHIISIWSDLMFNGKTIRNKIHMRYFHFISRTDYSTVQLVFLFDISISICNSFYYASKCMCSKNTGKHASEIGLPKKIDSKSIDILSSLNWQSSNI